MSSRPAPTCFDGRGDRIGAIDRGRSALRARRSRAFTLIEVAIALALVVLLAAIAWPFLEGRIERAQLPDSADKVRSMLAMARSSAIMENRRYRIRFEPGERQPIVEYEVDPILEPGEWEATEEAWANSEEEPILLGEVQVHQVQLGRPFWTEPLAEDEQPGDLEEDDEEGLEDLATAELAEAMSVSLSSMEDTEIDENRPWVVFDVDGSSDWALLILAAVDPEEELEEGTTQAWVLLDGRTGIAKIVDAWSEDDLNDPDKYVHREKLAPPFLADIDDLTLSGESGALAAGDAGPGGFTGTGGASPGGAGNFGGEVAVPDVGPASAELDGRGGGRGAGGAFGGGGGFRGRGGQGAGDRGPGGRGGFGQGGEGGGRGRGDGAGGGFRGRGGQGGGDRGPGDGGNRRGGGGGFRNRGGNQDDGGNQGNRGTGGGGRGNNGGQQGAQGAMQALEEALANDPNMTEAEREEIRQAFRQMLGGGGG